MLWDWLEYYHDEGLISKECYEAWVAAKAAYQQAVMTGVDFTAYQQARNIALTHHPETGDCHSDLIQISYDPLRCCDGSQLTQMAAEGDVIAKLELFIRGEN